MNPKLICYYLPQFHEIPENNQWWGQGFTEWTNVRKARPLYQGHYQPHEPTEELGYYDLTCLDVQRKQAELAARYGIHGFCYYYYWFQGRRLLERPLNQMVQSAIDFPFCVCWANENWTRAWDGGSHLILMKQDYSLEDDAAFLHSLCPLFQDRRYIRVGERPLLLVYHAEKLPQPLETVALWKRLSRVQGLPEPYLVNVHSFSGSSPRQFGFDASAEFPPHHLGRRNTIGRNPFLHSYPKAVKQSLRAQTAGLTLAGAPCETPIFRGVMPSWDNTPRVQRRGRVFVGAEPEEYEKWLQRTVELSSRQEEPLIFINAWNEWAEGCHLEPDQKYGHQYLEATRNAIG